MIWNKTTAKNPAPSTDSAKRTRRLCHNRVHVHAGAGNPIFVCICFLCSESTLDRDCVTQHGRQGNYKQMWPLKENGEGSSRTGARGKHSSIIDC